MENASKALLIAAAILIAIILIAFGVKVISSSSGTMKTGQETGEEIGAAAVSARLNIIRGNISKYCTDDERNPKTITRGEAERLVSLVNEYNQCLYDNNMLNTSTRIYIVGGSRTYTAVKKEERFGDTGIIKWQMKKLEDCDNSSEYYASNGTAYKTNGKITYDKNRVIIVYQERYIQEGNPTADPIESE